MIPLKATRREIPAAPRYVLAQTADGIQVTCTAPRNFLVIGFFSLWMIGWTLGETSAIRALISGEGMHHASVLFLSVWLTGWTIGGGLVSFAIAWQIAGRETILVNRRELLYSWHLFGLGPVKAYDAGQITHLRVLPSLLMRRGMPRSVVPTSWAAGAIGFDYGARCVRIACTLDEAEARLLIPRFLNCLPKSAVPTDVSA
jgi:hypothetical protein